MTVPNMNLSEAKSESREIPAADGYICKVIRARVDNQYNRLVLDLDIDEGPFKGYFTELEERANFWGLTWSLYMDKDSAWKFKNAVDCFRACNDSFTWEDDADNEESEMVGMRIGMITRHKEYIGNDGLTKKKLVTYKPITIQDVETKSFAIPEMIRAKEAPVPGTGKVVDTTAPDPVEGFGEVKDDDIPF